MVRPWTDVVGELQASIDLAGQPSIGGCAGGVNGGGLGVGGGGEGGDGRSWGWCCWGAQSFNGLSGATVDWWMRWPRGNHRSTANPQHRQPRSTANLAAPPTSQHRQP